MTKFFILVFVLIAFSCNDTEQKKPAKASDLIIMTPQGKNVAQMNDSLVIYETVCRGCEYEKSTHFEISDSMDLVKIIKIETLDQNSHNTKGGFIDKHIYMVPLKPGQTKIKLYKFNTETPTAQDSLSFTYYDILIKN
jgi:hypothetical protein